MLPGTIRSLTDRQRAVMERIDKRIPIKVIALDLGVSETRINQHIRALKDIYSAASLFELVKNYRIAEGRAGEEVLYDELPDSGSSIGCDSRPLSESAYKNQQLTGPFAGLHDWVRDDTGHLVIGDVMPLAERVSWLSPDEPRVVPGLLEGESAVLMRSIAVLGIAIGILAAVILTVTAAVALSNAMDGKADLPAEHWQGSV
jgi:DNA-binding CsgD family transcriptional regulator